MGLLAAPTRTRYNSARALLSAYCKLNCIFWYVLTACEQDFVLCDFIFDSKDADESPQLSVDLIAACQQEYLSQRIYKAAWAVVTGWKSQIPVAHAPPLPLDAAFAAASLAVLTAQPDVGVAIVLCFCAALRISEALALRTSDLVFVGSSVTILIRFSKCGVPGAYSSLGSAVVVAMGAPFRQIF